MSCASMDPELDWRLTQHTLLWLRQMLDIACACAPPKCR